MEQNAQELTSAIELQMHELVQRVLAEEYGDSWWTEGVPGHVRIKAASRFEAEKHAYPVQAYLCLIDFEEILESQWTLFARYLEQTKSQGKRRSLQWMQKLNDLRNRYAHPYKARLQPVSDEELEFLRERLAWLTKALETAPPARPDLAPQAPSSIARETVPPADARRFPPAWITASLITLILAALVAGGIAMGPRQPPIPSATASTAPASSPATTPPPAQSPVAQPPLSQSPMARRPTRILTPVVGFSCPDCKGPMYWQWSKKKSWWFLSCTRFPTCRGAINPPPEVSRPDYQP